MGRIQFTWLLIQVLIVWGVCLFFTHAAKRQKFDLNETWKEDETNEMDETNEIDETYESNETNNGVNILNSSTEGSSSNASRVKSRALWNAYVPAETSESKLETLIEMETHLISNNGVHTWDWSNLKQDPNAAPALCTRIWSTFKVKGLVLNRYRGSEPMCDKTKWRDMYVRSGGYYFIGHYRYSTAPSSKNEYYLNILRCECSYKQPGFQKSMKSTNTYFLVHQILPKQYLILSPVNPNDTSQRERSNINLVDFFEDS